MSRFPRRPLPCRIYRHHQKDSAIKAVAIENASRAGVPFPAGWAQTKANLRPKTCIFVSIEDILDGTQETMTPTRYRPRPFWTGSVKTQIRGEQTHIDPTGYPSSCRASRPAAQWLLSNCFEYCSVRRENNANEMLPDTEFSGRIVLCSVATLVGTPNPLHRMELTGFDCV